MKKETFDDLKKRYSKIRKDAVFKSYEKMHNADAKKAILFIQKLRKSNIPLDKIDVSDWETAPIIVYLLDRKYYRFSNYDLLNAIKYYKFKKKGK